MNPAPLVFTSPIASLLLVLALKSTVVLIGALLAAWALRGASAAARHALWTIAVIAWIAIPALELAAPPLTARVPAQLSTMLPVSPSDLARASSESERPAPIATEHSAAKKKDLPRSGKAVHGRESWEPTPTIAEPSGPIAPMADSIPLTMLLLGIWIGGSLVVAGFFATGWAMLIGIARRAHPVEDPAWMDLLDATRARLGIRRPVRLLIGDDMVAPVTWGTLRPTILLPASASAWAPAHRVAILTHELAHAARFDCAIQHAAHLACAFYWWHPGVWLAAQRLRVERESACDDVVLAAGAAAADYAGQLVDVVRAGRRPGLVLEMSGAAMARRSDLERRVRAILDQAIDRRSVPLGRVLVAGGLAAALILPLGALEFTASAAWDENTQKEAAEAPPEKAAAIVEGENLAERWRRAIGSEGKSSPYWIAYAIEFNGGINGREILMTDSEHFDWNELAKENSGTTLARRFGIAGTDAVFLFRFPRAGKAADRIAIRTASLKPDLGGKPVLWLGRFPHEESFAWMEKQFRPMPDNRPAQVMVKAIAIHQTPGVAPLLIEILDGKRAAESRSNAAEGLALHPGQPALDALVAAANHDRSVDVSAEAAESIGEMRYPPATDALIKLAREAEPDRVRGEAVESLADREPQRVVQVLESIALQDKSESVQMEATETLGDLPDQIGWPALRRIAAEHPNAGVRAEAFETLGDKARGHEAETDKQDAKKHDQKSGTLTPPTSRHEKELKAYRSHEDVEALGARDDYESVRQLRMVALEHPDPELRSEALETLAHKDAKQALLVLHRAALRDPEESVRTEAIESMGELDLAAAWTALEDFADHGPDAASRAEAFETLAEKAPERALALVDRWIKAGSGAPPRKS